MTCIVGIEHGGHVWIGGDSAGVDESYGIVTRCDEKVFVSDPMIMGFAGSFRMGQLLRYALDIPEQSAKKDDMEFLVVDFIDVLREVYKDHGHMGKEDGRDEGGTFLLGYHGKLYTVHEDFQVGRAADGYVACGCGEDIALGSLHSTRESNIDPTTRIRMALDAACHHSAGVRAPYTILCL